MESFDRYLRLLGVPRREPSLDALTELVQAHLERVPFENISNLYYKKHDRLHSYPDLQLFLDGIEFSHFGGTCYANNYHLNSLLVHLGYDVTLCGADMSHPDVHVVSLVRFEGREYLLDVGYGAPFLEPMPRDLREDFVITYGNSRYVLSPQDSEGRSRLTMCRDGQPRHGYTVKPTPRIIADFAPAIADAYRPEATFMNAVLIVTFAPDRSRVLHNFNSIETTGSQTISTLHKRAEIADEAQRLFEMPRDIVTDAIHDIPAFRDAWE